ncbi:hypothetical protein [Pelosinus sp. UFO1]|uniref:BC1872 family protein n=1 Tax=Pelosinus sp. UFO1 TaxID=484770 RepID=UPI0004D1AA89|nr:hypothetical protein [Pelosinus sp. UFO1]AIF52027.1 hypothetical protein UFO1_2480 [Pelosinus sp. UFO1]
MKADYEQIDQFITREQVLAAKGHELSLLVAKHIMHDHITIISIHNDTGCQDIESCKDYALDIAAAWEIVKKLKDDGLLIIMIDTPKDYYHFRVLKNGNGWRGYKSKTAPEAICKASLLAMLEVEAG